MKRIDILLLAKYGIVAQVPKKGVYPYIEIGKSEFKQYGAGDLLDLQAYACLASGIDRPLRRVKDWSTTTDLDDSDIFDVRNFRDFLSISRRTARREAISRGYGFYAWTDGCVYEASTGDVVFRPKGEVNDEKFSGWLRGYRYGGRSNWLKGCLRRGFELIPLRA